MQTDFSWDNLIAAIGAERFESDYFGRKPLHLKSCFTPATGLESLAGWHAALAGQTVTPEVHRGFVTIDTAADTGRPPAPDLAAALENGGPLIIDGINKISPAVEAMAAALARGLASFVGVNAYISPSRKDALDLHFDDHDVIVLQLGGAKHWTLGSRVVRGVAASRFFQVDQTALKRRAMDTDSFETLVLEAGDLLYLPRGLFHRATAHGNLSIHLSFGIRRPTGMDFIEFVTQRLLRDPEVRDCLPRLGMNGAHDAVRATMDSLMTGITRLGHDPALRDDFLRDYARKFDGITDRGDA